MNFYNHFSPSVGHHITYLSMPGLEKMGREQVAPWGQAMEPGAGKNRKYGLV